MNTVNTKLLSARNIWLTVGFLLVVVLITYTAFWVVISDRAKAALSDWADGQRHFGYEIGWARLETTGYPLDLDLVVHEPRVENVNSVNERRWVWDLDLLTLTSRPWNWKEVRLKAPDEHRITVSSLKDEGVQDFLVVFGNLEVDARFRGDAWQHIDVVATNIRVRENDRVIATLGSFEGYTERTLSSRADERTLTGRLGITLQNIEIPSIPTELANAAGSVVRDFSTALEFYGPLPQRMKSQALSSWRDHGGVIEVRSMRASYGPLKLEVEGSVALDTQLQPVGSFVAEIVGYSNAVDILNEVGVFSERDAQAAKLILSLLADHDAATGTSQLSLPITVQDRVIQAGPLPLGRIPTVTW